MIDLYEIAERLDRPQFYGHYFTACCPFHGEEKPSFFVYPDRYRCMSCEATGFTRTLLNQLDDVYVKKSKPAQNPWRRWLKAHDELEDILKLAHKNSNTPLMGYVRSRGIKQKTIDKLKLGWLDGWITFPVNGVQLGGVARNIYDSMYRYMTPQGQGNMLYKPSRNAVAKSKYVFLVFGMFDAITLYQMGFPAVTTTMGIGKQTHLFDGIRKRIFIIPDNQSNELRIARQLNLGWRGKVVKDLFPEDCKDINDFYLKDKKELKKKLKEIVR